MEGRIWTNFYKERIKNIIMRKILYQGIVYLVVFLLTPVSLQASDINNRLSFPEVLYREKEYYRVVTEVLREQFHQPKKAEEKKLNLLLVKSYFHLEDYIALKTAARSILSEEGIYDIEEKQEVAKYLTLIYLKENKENKAKHIWEKYVLHKEDKSFFLSSNILGQIDPERAGLYSAIVPGSGMLLTGEYGKAAVSFLLNIGFLLGTYQYYHRGAYGIAGLLLFFEIGWYKGGINASKESAENYNRRLVQDRKNRWIEYNIRF